MVESLQRSGLLVLFLLLAVVAASIVLPRGSEKGVPEPVRAAAVPGEILEAELVPPEQRRVFLDASHFREPPIRSPREGGRLRDRRVPEALSPAGTRPYRVRPGETLSRIAAEQLGEAGRWKEIAALNPELDPDRVPAGARILLPAAPAPPREGGAETAAAEVPVPPAPAVREYRVSPRETPGEISQAVYGTSRYWRELLEANGIDDPRKLRAGQVLRVPDLAELRRP